MNLDKKALAYAISIGAFALVLGYFVGNWFAKVSLVIWAVTPALAGAMGWFAYEIHASERTPCHYCNKRDGSVHYCFYLKNVDYLHCGDCHMKFASQQAKEESKRAK